MTTTLTGDENSPLLQKFARAVDTRLTSLLRQKEARLTEIESLPEAEQLGFAFEKVELLLRIRDLRYSLK